MNHEIRITETMGRGVFASRDVAANTCICVCELLVLDQSDTYVVNATALQHYTFKYNDTQDCLVLGVGELFNHADSPNVSYILESYGDRKVMAFYSTKDIKTGDQLFIDYAADTIVDTNTYKNTKGLY